MFKHENSFKEANHSTAIRNSHPPPPEKQFKKIAPLGANKQESNAITKDLTNTNLILTDNLEVAIPQASYIIRPKINVVFRVASKINLRVGQSEDNFFFFFFFFQKMLKKLVGNQKVLH